MLFKVTFTYKYAVLTRYLPKIKEQREKVGKLVAEGSTSYLAGCFSEQLVETKLCCKQEVLALKKVTFKVVNNHNISRHNMI